MSSETRPSSDLLFIAQEEPAEISRTARIKTIADALTSSKKPYKVLEFEDGKKIRAFDLKQVEGLEPGMEVDYGLKKNDKTGYWDLTAIKQAEHKPAPETAVASPELVTGRGSERFDLDRERSMRSMNALTNATTLLAALIQKDIVKPAGVDQAVAMIGDLHDRFLVMHDPGHHDSGT